MLLSELLEGLTFNVTAGNSGNIVNPADVEIKDVVNDNRKITEGSLFLCIQGANFDGHSCAAEAAEKKAGAIVVCHDVELPEGCEMPVVRVEDTRYAMAFISAAYFGHPAKKLKTIGITGTKGKTTTTYLIRDMLQYYMSKMVEAGCDSVVMEVSSQGLMLHRSQGFVFDMGIFTNIEPDHIGPNEHKDFEDYMHCKGLLFKQCKVGICNADDPHTEDILEGHTCEVEKYGFSEGADIRAINLAYIHKPGQLGVFFDTDGLINMHAEIRTPGKFSVYNALCAIAVARHFGCTPEEIAPALKEAKVKGRIEMVKVSDDFTLMIDYAHNAMALKSLLTTLKDYHPNRLICLFGCGGNRSRYRRFEMGEVSGKYADFTVITSDNPRFEEPEAIIDDIETGMKKTDGKYIKITDRKEAIRYVIENGEKGDIIVLAGKGHEDYQEIKGVKYHMDERELIQEILDEQ